MTTATRRAADRRPPRSTAGSVALILFATLVAIGALGAIAVVGGYIALSADLTDPHELENIRPQEESIVYARDGETELARFGELQREVVSFDEIPAILVDATTAVEDKTFWTNSGFDPAAIVAAGVDALRGNARGASTITQQLVRQRLLDEDLVQAPGRTVERKLKEIIQSIRLTQTYPGEQGKQDIIAAYLNQNFYGNNSYGVKAAARNYFNKSLEELTLSEVALLAALPQSPSSYDLVRNAVVECNLEVEEDAECPAAESRLVVPADTDIVRRRNMVLGYLAEPDRRPLSQDQYSVADIEAAAEEEVVLAPQTEDRWTAPHFVWQVREELAATLCPDSPTCDALEQGGLRITTTLDLELQQAAERWVQLAARVPRFRNPEAAAERLGFDELPDWVARLENRELHNGALVALDYETGELVAYVGSANYYSGGAKPQFQPKFDVVGDGWRQPGSAFKPLNYVTGFDDGTLTPATMFMDTVTDFGGGYTPNDADRLERGPLRVRQALQFSLNIPAVKAMAVNRVEHVFDRAQEYGVRWREPTTDAGLAFALGVEEIRPIDLVTAYGTLGNQGRYVGHTTILEVTDASGGPVVERHQAPEGEQVLKPESAALMTDILAGNTVQRVNPFWGRFAIDGGDERRPATLKTGTNNDAKDLNAYGYIAPPTAEGRAAGEYALAVGAWNGNSDNSLVSTPERPLFSVEVSTYVWQGFLNEATEGWAVNEFARPDSLVRVEVDPWTGFLPAEGEDGVAELFIPGTEPQARVGSSGGVCGRAILDQTFESRFDNWLEADLDWIERARRGPGTRGGLENTPVSYFYNSGFTPYGRSWGPLLDGGGCATPEPSPTCFPVPTPDPSGVVPSFEAPSPEGSGPAPEPCPTEAPTPSPSPSESAPPSEPPTEPPSEPPTEPPTEPPSEPPTEPPGPPTEPPAEPTEPPDAEASGQAGGAAPSGAAP